MIPKIIHQTWKTNKIPDNWKKAVDSCKTEHGDYKYILWTDATMKEFMKNEYPSYYDLYKNYKYNIQRCDVFRYFVLYKYGGIYLDMDILCKKKLDTYLKYNIVLSKSSNVSTFTNSFFMSEPNNKFIKFCIDNLNNYRDSLWFLGKHMHIMSSTGPIYLSNIIHKYGLNNIKNSYVLTNDEFAGDCCICNEGTCKGGIYFKHIKGQSWNSFDSLFFNFVLCNTKLITFAIILILLFLNRNKISNFIKR
jgi:mannosyltransferase OCH1-like enzyme